MRGSRGFLKKIQNVNITFMHRTQHRDNTHGRMKKVAWVSGDFSVQHAWLCLGGVHQQAASTGRINGLRR